MCIAKLSVCCMLFSAVRAVMGCNTLPPSPPDFSTSPNQLQLLSLGLLYVYDIDSNCSGCVTAINQVLPPLTQMRGFLLQSSSTQTELLSTPMMCMWTQ